MPIRRGEARVSTGRNTQARSFFDRNRTKTKNGPKKNTSSAVYKSKDGFRPRVRAPQVQGRVSTERKEKITFPASTSTALDRSLDDVIKSLPKAPKSGRKGGGKSKPHSKQVWQPKKGGEANADAARRPEVQRSRAPTPRRATTPRGQRAGKASEPYNAPAWSWVSTGKGWWQGYWYEDASCKAAPRVRQSSKGHTLQGPYQNKGKGRPQTIDTASRASAGCQERPAASSGGASAGDTSRTDDSDDIVFDDVEECVVDMAASL